ncbi:hypothetical protein PE067_09170 [Paracoccus sp. DMF-8]|uniref:hypothetical protein n=1 Tax=Paracoccus sp. DMF-8 TaxID=3019445 RepID=UPI0023E78A9D|nr:hypothetical protein [Paracoccus sp. DMF-8]MDF3606288.1 hypothetical protein [Paracoccus sp. DMF-8]
MQTYDPKYDVALPIHEVRALLRIATMPHDPRLINDVWIRNMAAKCGLDLDDPEGANARRAAA